MTKLQTRSLSFVRELVLSISDETEIADTHVLIYSAWKDGAIIYNINVT